MYDGTSDHGDNGVYLIEGNWEVTEHYKHDRENIGKMIDLSTTINENNEYQRNVLNGIPAQLAEQLEAYKAGLTNKSEKE